MGAMGFQSTLPMRGATLHQKYGDKFLEISIHAPHAGSDHIGRKNFLNFLGFQSTLPMRGATMERSLCAGGSHDFNPRSPCGERRKSFFQ